MKRDDIRDVMERLEMGDSTSALQRIRAAREGPGAAPIEDSEAILATLQAVVAASMALREGRVDELVRQGRRAAALCPALPEVQLRVGSVLQGAFRFTGDPALEVDTLTVLGRVADRVDQPDAAVLARALMGTVHLLSGAFHSCIELCDAALALAGAAAGTEPVAAARSEPGTKPVADPVADPVGVALAHQFRGYVLYEWNRLDDADSALDEAWALSEGSAGVRSGVARVRASLASARGDTDAMEYWFEQLTATVAEPLTLRNREWLAAVRARVTLGGGGAIGNGAGSGPPSGRLREIDGWLRAFGYRAAVVSRPDAWIASRLHELEGALTLLEATSQWAAADPLAERMAAVATGRRRWFEARAESVRAMAAEAEGRAFEAESAWRRALIAGREGSFVRAYLEGSPQRIVALRRLADGGDRDAERVLEATAPERVNRPAARSPLTERQTDVLRLVERGLSNKAVGRALGLSVSTVKTHLRATFARLEVSSRTEAVARARDREWL